MIEPTYTTHEIARYCGVYPSSVVRWIHEGHLKAHHTPGGHQRVGRAELIRFLKAHGTPVPDEVSTPQSRVLVVDDDRDTARLIERAFSRHPERFLVETCRDGVEALVRIGQNPPDLLVLDLVLPKLDGFQVCRVLKAMPQTKKTRIVLISGTSARVNEKKLEEAKIDAFYRKPLDLPAMVKRCASLLNVPLEKKKEVA